MILPGQVRRISVAVMVDGIAETAADGSETWAPRPPEEMETLRQLVQSAIGFDAERGDTVTIESLQFTLPPEQGSLAERGRLGLPRRQRRPPRPARRARRDRAGADLLRAAADDQPRGRCSSSPSSPARASSTPRRRAAARRRSRGDILDLPAQTVTKIERLRDVITSRSEDSAAVLRSWIESPDTRKEPAGS